MGAPLVSKAPLFTSSSHEVGGGGRGGGICADPARCAPVPLPSGGAVITMAVDRGTTTKTSKANAKCWLRCV
jgi:hypothetical protein